MTNNNGNGSRVAVTTGLQRNGSNGSNSNNGGGGDNASVSSGSNHSNGNNANGSNNPSVSKAARKRQRRRNKKRSGTTTTTTTTTTTPEFVTIEEEYVQPASSQWQGDALTLLVKYGGVILVPLISLALTMFTSHWFEGTHPSSVNKPEVFIGQPAPLPDFARPRVYGEGGSSSSASSSISSFSSSSDGVDVGDHWAQHGRMVQEKLGSVAAGGGGGGGGGALSDVDLDDVDLDVMERLEGLDLGGREVVTTTSTEIHEDTYVDENGEEVKTRTMTTTTHLTFETMDDEDYDDDDDYDEVEGASVGGTPMSAVLEGLSGGAEGLLMNNDRRESSRATTMPPRHDTRRRRPAPPPPDPADHINPKPKLCSDGVTFGYSDWNSLRSAVHSLNDFNDALRSGVYSDGAGSSSYYHGLPDLPGPGGTHNAVHYNTPPHMLTKSTHPEAIPDVDVDVDVDRGQPRQQQQQRRHSHSTVSTHHTHRVMVDGEEVRRSSYSDSPRYYTEWDEDEDEDEGYYYYDDYGGFDDDDGDYYDYYYEGGEEEPIPPPPPPFVVCPGTTIQSTGWTSSLIRLGSSFSRPIYSSSSSSSSTPGDGGGNNANDASSAAIMNSAVDRGKPIYVNSEDVTLECDACVVHLGGTHLSFGPNAKNVVVRGWTFVGARTSSLTFHHHGAEATFEDCTWMGNSGLANGGAVADLNSTSSVSFFRCEISDSKQAPRVVNGHGNTPVVGSSLTIRN